MQTQPYLSTTQPERWAVALAGASLVLWGAHRLAGGRQRAGTALATTGLGFLWHAGRQNTRQRLRGSRGTIVEESFAINRPARELYEFWRDLEQLPRVMPELLRVQTTGPRRSHWVAQGPAGVRVDWDAEIINDIPNELIAWRTVPGSRVASAGSIHFDEGPRGRGTVVRIKLQYDPPGGKAGALFARAFGSAPSQVIREGLRRFKQLMETGEIPSIEGQPRGAR